jgi:hypothetical protein
VLRERRQTQAQQPAARAGRSARQAQVEVAREVSRRRRVTPPRCRAPSARPWRLPARARTPRACSCPYQLPRGRLAPRSFRDRRQPRPHRSAGTRRHVQRAVSAAALLACGRS